MTKKRFIAIFMLLIPALIVGGWLYRPGYEFPATSEIGSIDAQFYDVDGEHEKAFRVPQVHWDEIIAAFQPSQLDRSPAKWQHFGDLQIKKRDGETIEVFLFDLSNNPVGAFAAGRDWDSRNYYRGGNSRKLRAAIEKAYARSRQGNSK